MSENNNNGEAPREDAVKVFTAAPNRRVVQRGFDADESFVDDDEPTLENPAMAGELTETV